MGDGRAQWERAKCSPFCLRLPLEWLPNLSASAGVASFQKVRTTEQFSLEGTLEDHPVHPPTMGHLSLPQADQRHPPKCETRLLPPSPHLHRAPTASCQQHTAVGTAQGRGTDSHCGNPGMARTGRCRARPPRPCGSAAPGCPRPGTPWQQSRRCPPRR